MPCARKQHFELLAELEHDVSVSTRAQWKPPGKRVLGLIIFYFGHWRKARGLTLSSSSWPFGFPSPLCLFFPLLLFENWLPSRHISTRLVSEHDIEYLGTLKLSGQLDVLSDTLGGKGSLSRVRTLTCLHSPVLAAGAELSWHHVLFAQSLPSRSQLHLALWPVALSSL